jgi:hypothetical protein
MGLQILVHAGRLHEISNKCLTFESSILEEIKPVAVAVLGCQVIAF